MAAVTDRAERACVRLEFALTGGDRSRRQPSVTEDSMAEESGATSSPPASRRGKRALAAGVLLAAIVVAVGLALPLSSFSHETSGHRAPLVPRKPAPANRGLVGGRTPGGEPS